MNIRYFIDVDEEGHPMFDGVRIQDDGLTRVILEGAHRRKAGDPRTPLVTECDGETCILNAFSDPWVAQLCVFKSSDTLEWTFPGGFQREVTLSQVAVDKWNRCHAYLGPNEVPSVLSRKAQAMFLEDLHTRGLDVSFKPKPWRRINENRVEIPQFWEETYRDGKDGWEMGGPNPVLVSREAAVRGLVPPPARLLVPGPGRGHDAVFLEKMGYNVTAVDFSEEALTGFRKNYPASKLDYKSENIFETLAGSVGKWDAVFEHTLFVALDPALRERYVEAVAKALKPGGTFFGIFLVRTNPGGPAFGLTQWELRELVKDRFDIRAWEVARDSEPKRLGIELWAALRLKP